MRAVTESAELQVAEAWAAVEEQASVAAHALRTTALRSSSSGTTNEQTRRDSSGRSFRSSLVRTRPEQTSPPHVSVGSIRATILS